MAVAWRRAHLIRARRLGTGWVWEFIANTTRHALTSSRRRNRTTRPLTLRATPVPWDQRLRVGGRAHRPDRRRRRSDAERAASRIIVSEQPRRMLADRGRLRSAPLDQEQARIDREALGHRVRVAGRKSDRTPRAQHRPRPSCPSRSRSLGFEVERTHIFNSGDSAAVKTLLAQSGANAYFRAPTTVQQHSRGLPCTFLPTLPGHSESPDRDAAGVDCRRPVRSRASPRRRRAPNDDASDIVLVLDFSGSILDDETIRTDFAEALDGIAARVDETAVDAGRGRRDGFVRAVRDAGGGRPGLHGTAAARERTGRGRSRQLPASGRGRLPQGRGPRADEGHRRRHELRRGDGTGRRPSPARFRAPGDHLLHGRQARGRWRARVATSSSPATSCSALGHRSRSCPWGWAWTPTTAPASRPGLPSSGSRATSSVAMAGRSTWPDVVFDSARPPARPSPWRSRTSPARSRWKPTPTPLATPPPGRRTGEHPARPRGLRHRGRLGPAGRRRIDADRGLPGPLPADGRRRLDRVDRRRVDRDVRDRRRARQRRRIHLRGLCRAVRRASRPGPRPA